MLLINNTNGRTTAITGGTNIGTATGGGTTGEVTNGGVTTGGGTTTGGTTNGGTTGGGTPPTSTTFELNKTQASMNEEIAFNYAVTSDRSCTISTVTTSRLLMNIAAGASGQ